MASFFGIFVAAAAGATCGGTSGKPGSQDKPKGDGAPEAQDERAEFRLFAFGRVLGTIAPCGCTTEPLGGLQYAFGRIDDVSSEDNRVVVEPGSFLYPVPEGPYWPEDEAAWKQAEQRAGLLQSRFEELGDALVSGVGPTDLVSDKGAKALAEHPLPRVVANYEGSGEAPAKGEGKAEDAKPSVAFEPVRMVELKSHGITWKVGVTTVVDPELEGLKPLGEFTEAAPALTKAVETMKSQGAGLTVAMAHGDRAFAESLAREVEGIDIVVVGLVEGVERTRLGTPAAKVGGAWVLEPAEQLQTVSELRLSIDPKAKTVPDIDAWNVVPAKSVLEEELARVTERIEKFKADPNAEAAFVARLEDEKKKLEAKIAAKPEGEAVAVFEQRKITCKLPVDEPAKKMLAGYDKSVAEANKARFAGVKPPPPAKGEAGYVGIEACSDCHQEAVDFWEGTVHAAAYETLVVDNKQFDLSCVGCHVTGFRKPGGSEVVENEGLVDVQCEVCHGPGSLHVDDGGDDLSLIERDTTADLCALECHTPEHSDTFDYIPYLRDVLGPGHGEDRRKALGEGPTGAELRAAGLAKAGGPCKKMM